MLYEHFPHENIWKDIESVKWKGLNLQVHTQLMPSHFHVGLAAMKGLHHQVEDASVERLPRGSGGAITLM